MNLAAKLRKIIHVDMDCFYAAIEIRDDPSLIGKPVAVGGSAMQRGVICTCNYVARQLGVHAAMSTAVAYRHCPDLIVLPTQMTQYRNVAQRIRNIFYEFTDLVEPLALDEAYLDVSDASHCQGSATLMAEAIRQKIWQTEQLTASAGVAPNKFLAKIASGWNKPNGLYVIPPAAVVNFVTSLPVKQLWGVGKVTADKLNRLGLHTCADLQRVNLIFLTQHFGKLGLRLYQQCRGMDDREVEANRCRKSLSVEQTFTQDIQDIENHLNSVYALYEKLMRRVSEFAPQTPIKNQFVKLKWSDFKLATAETVTHELNLDQYLSLLRQLYERENKSIRLIGLGVHFDKTPENSSGLQLPLLD